MNTEDEVRTVLSDEQIIAIRKTVQGNAAAAWSDTIAFARAIEKAALSLPLTQAVGAGWLPISSAPKDGTEVWAFNGEQARMKWIEGDGYALWIWADELLSEVDASPSQPTYFQALPASPTGDQQ